MKLPCTSEHRRDRGFLRLLTFVDPAAPAGLQFDGQLLTPGADYDPADLPRPAVVLECAGPARIAAPRSRYSFEMVWILWRFDFDRAMWIEIVKTTSRDASWTIDFAPIAHAYLRGVREELPEEQAADVSGRIRDVITAELGRVAREVRSFVLAQVSWFVSSEMVRSSEPISIARVGPAYARIGGRYAQSSPRARALR